MQTIRDGAEEIAEAMRRVARELREPHDAVEATTKRTWNASPRLVRRGAATKIIKLANKLDECSLTTNCEDASRRRRDASELSKAAKLLGEIKVTRGRERIARRRGRRGRTNGVHSRAYG